MTSGTPPRKSGTISVIIALFLASSVIRFVEIGPAIAEEVGVLGETDPHRNAEMATVEPEPDIPALLAAIQEREAQLAEREAYIARRNQTLAAAEQRIQEQMVALNDAEAKLSATLAIADGATEEDVARLTEVYQRMKPAEAAGIFETMDIQFAAGFFSRMRPESSAAIMANLPAELAYSISVVMAGRNANAPRE